MPLNIYNSFDIFMKLILYFYKIDMFLINDRYDLMY